MAWEKFKYAETETVLPAKICVIDELAEFLTNLDRKDMRLGDKMQGNIQSIARLGRSAHIHVVLATQSASGDLFPSSLKNNIATRFIAGRVEANISRMAIDSEEGESLPLTPGSYLGYSKGDTCQFQGYFTPTKEILSLGTVKEGYDPKTGLEISEDAYDLSPVEDYGYSNNQEQEMPSSDSFSEDACEEREVLNENSNEEKTVFTPQDFDLLIDGTKMETQVPSSTKIKISKDKIKLNINKSKKSSMINLDAVNLNNEKNGSITIT